MDRLPFASRCLAGVFCVALSAAPWIRALAEPCYPPPSGNCKTKAQTSDCPCAPTGGYKACSGYGKQENCLASTGHLIFPGGWQCATSTKSGDICKYGSTANCWEQFSCKWDAEKSKCSIDDTGLIDNANYVQVVTGVCGS